MAPLSRTVDDDDLQLAIDGLRPFTTYRVRVEAATEIGAGPPSAAVTCRTAEAGPETAFLWLSLVEFWRVFWFLDPLGF